MARLSSSSRRATGQVPQDRGPRPHVEGRADVQGVGTDERSRNRFRSGLYAAAGLDKNLCQDCNLLIPLAKMSGRFVLSWLHYPAMLSMRNDLESDGKVKVYTGVMRWRINLTGRNDSRRSIKLRCTFDSIRVYLRVLMHKLFWVIILGMTFVMA